MGPTGKLLKPMGDLAFEDCCAIYREVVEIGAAAGAAFILIETMSDSYETKAAVLALSLIHIFMMAAMYVRVIAEGSG